MEIPSLIKAPVKIYLDQNFAQRYDSNYESNYMLALESSIDVIPQDPKSSLCDVFSSLNIGLPLEDMANEWRNKNLRSLSICDIVVIGETAFRCEPDSWSVVDASELPMSGA